MVSHSLCTQLDLTLDMLEEVRAYVAFRPEDADNLEQVRRLIAKDLNAIIARFYAHVSSFESVRPFLEEEPAMRHLRWTLRSYILTLGKDTEKLEYAEHRLRIGLSHERIGLSLKWYLGVYASLFEAIATSLVSALAPDPDRRLPGLLISLQKALTLDSVLVAQTYHSASTHRLEEVVEGCKTSQEQLRREATTDGLTQVFNRQAVMTALEAEFLECQRHQRPFALLILDVDRFKQINDSHGHPFGDFVLRHVVDIVRTILRPGDIVGRFGGDEIIVGLGGCSLDEAERIAERIRLKVVLAPFQDRGQSARVTLSIGVASLSLRSSSLDRIIDEADQAMYRAKQAGRNRTCLASVLLDAGGLEFMQS